ncbi:BLUF domain-containing protein [Polynucleobacter sp. IMCC30063]|uniref:BLUF domain-containing protein n=1 Tax=unclassified Polynucleobacter TaxID=2640945 RepID=UPI001F1B6A65|nr:MULTISPECIES: BLUF domain-containing protein [unclassified Polynucleobacter]MCE7506503.1 BLUF domain-containing protein [Polynucleobacter sp. IMCC30063]MCE7527775.1 BLUF domain-containing protein [Polynucleobacter sp. IMCC 30228]
MALQTTHPSSGPVGDTELVSLSYVSELKQPLETLELMQLVDLAIARNSSLNITGVLSCEGNRFCQIIEGPAAAIETLWSSIKNDQRHYNIFTLGTKKIKQRAFANWSMRLIDSKKMATFNPKLKNGD